MGNERPPKRPARASCVFYGAMPTRSAKGVWRGYFGGAGMTERAIIEAIIEAIGGIIAAFVKGIAWGAGITLGVMAMWGYLGGVAT